MTGTVAPGANLAIRVARVTPSEISRTPSGSWYTKIGGIPSLDDPNCRICWCSFQGSAPLGRLGGSRRSLGSTSRIGWLIPRIQPTQESHKPLLVAVRPRCHGRQTPNLLVERYVPLTLRRRSTHFSFRDTRFRARRFPKRRQPQPHEPAPLSLLPVIQSQRYLLRLLAQAKRSKQPVPD